MKLADDYNIRQYYAEESLKHLQLLNCTPEEAISVTEWDIMVDEGKDNISLDDCNWVLRSLGQSARQNGILVDDYTE